MRRILNVIRAKRDAWRSAIYRWRYDAPRSEIDQFTGLQRVVFMRWDAKWGDSVIFSLVVPELRKLAQKISIEVVATPEMAPLFTEHFGVDRVHVIRKRPSTREIRSLAREIGSIDLLVHFSEVAKPRDILFMHCTDARYIASLDDSVNMTSIKLGKVTQGLHMEERYSELLKCCGIVHPENKYIVPRQEASQRSIKEYLGQRKRPFIAVNPFSKGRAKSFNIETTKRLIEYILYLVPSHDVCLLTAPGYQREIGALAGQWDSDRCFYYPDTRTIFDNVALLSNASAQLTASTATVHIADGLGVASFVLFPHAPGELATWHSVHPLSISMMGLPSAVDDVNCLDWNEVEKKMEMFFENISGTEKCSN